MKINVLPNSQIAEEAAQWAVLIDCGSLTSGERQSLADWLTTSPVHVDELVLSASLMAGLGHVDGARAISTRELLERAAPEVVPLFDSADSPPTESAYESANDGRDDAAGEAGSQSGLAGHFSKPHFLTGRLFAAAASVALVLLAGLAFVLNGPSFSQSGLEEGRALQFAGNQDLDHYTTTIGEQRSIALEDGSIVYMNTNSEMRVSFTENGRRINLLRGEAMFEVAHDADRPFRVYGHGSVAQAVGTKFNVEMTPNGINVVVVEGRVLVKNRSEEATLQRAAVKPARGSGEKRNVALPNAEPIMLLAGDQAQLSSALARPQVTSANIEAATSWRMRQLLFEHEGLGEIAAEFNRYNRTKIVLSDQSIVDMRFSGLFNADDPDSFIDFLELSTGVEVDRSQAGQFVLRRTQQ